MTDIDTEETVKLVKMMPTTVKATCINCGREEWLSIRQQVLNKYQGTMKEILVSMRMQWMYLAHINTKNQNK